MNLLFFLTPKQDVLFIYEDFTLRQTLEKWSNQRYATIPVLKRNGEYLGTMTGWILTPARISRSPLSPAAGITRQFPLPLTCTLC